MAFCTKCGNQLAEGAQFCTSCGAAVGAAPVAQPPAQPAPGYAPAYPPQVAPPARTRSPLVWVIPLVLVALIVVGAGAWFGFQLLSGGTESGRAKAQVETVAKFIESLAELDQRTLTSVLPDELADDVEAILEDQEGSEGGIIREWDGATLLLTRTFDDESIDEDTLALTADGAKERAIVTVIEGYGEDEYTTEVVLERDGGRWVIVEIDGTPVADILVSDDGSDDSSDYDSSEYGDLASAETCWENQSAIEAAASEYYFAAAENEYTDVEGDVDEYNWLVQDGYLYEPLYCPEDGSVYYLWDDGTTSCPSGVHGYYLDNE